MLTSLEGKSVIVTGGSKGIGRGIAQVFARHGAKLTIAARNEEDLKTTVSEIGGDTRYEVCDVADLVQCKNHFHFQSNLLFVLN